MRHRRAHGVVVDVGTDVWRRIYSDIDEEERTGLGDTGAALREIMTRLIAEPSRTAADIEAKLAAVDAFLGPCQLAEVPWLWSDGRDWLGILEREAQEFGASIPATVLRGLAESAALPLAELRARDRSPKGRDPPHV